MRSLFPLVSVFTVLISTSAAAGDTPKIMAAAVENTASAEVVRLVVSPSVKADDYKIVCGDGMIRVRLAGISNRGQTIQSLSVPSGGPLYRVRIIEKNPTYSVVQLFPKRSPLDTCERTSVTPIGGEIIISTAFSEAEMMAKLAFQEAAARKKADLLKKAGHKAPEKVAERVDSKVAEHVDSKVEKMTPPTVQAQKSAAVSESPKAQTKASPTDNNDKKSLFRQPTAGSLSDGLKPGGQEVMSAPKLALGFGFATVVAGFALFYRKRKKSPIAAMENIEILSTKRLGLKHQLMLVSVQDVKFLLAVSDKTVTSLGVVPGSSAGQIAGAGNAPVVETPLGPTALPKNNVAEVLESLIGEASHRAARPVTQDYRTDRRAFNEEFGRAMQANQKETEHREISTPNSASNAAGLVALARMRANIRKNSGKAQVFEA
jgi:flagellar biogenesis protein FliO